LLTTIPGPGFAYTIAGLAEAADDSCGLLFLVAKPAPQKFGLQVLSQNEIVKPIVRHTVEINRADEIVPGLVEAYRAAMLDGEPGPVLIEYDSALLTERSHSSLPSLPEPLTSNGGATADLLRAVATRLKASRKPVVLLGQGVLDAIPQTQALCERLKAPIITTRSARGICSAALTMTLTFDQSKAGLALLNELLAESDLILAIGCKLSHNGSFGFGLRLDPAKFVHIDAAQGVLGANYAARLCVQARAEVAMPALLNSLESSAAPASSWTAEALAAWKAKAQARETSGEPQFVDLKPATAATFFEALNAALGPKGVLVTDSGQHQVLATRYFRSESPGGFILPSDFQSMGFGLPAAIATKLGRSDRKVVALVGDGGLLMSGPEIGTAVREKIDLTIIVFNDGALGQIRSQQIDSFGQEFGTTLRAPDWRMFAESLGATYVRLTGNAVETLRSAISSRGVTLVDVRLADDSSVHIRKAKGVLRSTVRRFISQRPPRTGKGKVIAPSMPRTSVQ
jgi:acetolactate synthase-1/2/3 large subunit